MKFRDWDQFDPMDGLQTVAVTAQRRRMRKLCDRHSGVSLLSLTLQPDSLTEALDAVMRVLEPRVAEPLPDLLS